MSVKKAHTTAHKYKSVWTRLDPIHVSAVKAMRLTLMEPHAIVS